MPIPRTVHQLWKTADVPARFTALRETWRRHNPGWTIRLWTDRDLEDLVARRYPELLATFRGYAAPICRADLGRYLVLESFGGVYADLDHECLKPLELLLDGHELVVGFEPQANLTPAVAAASGLSRLICPTFIASAPGHPFWAHVRQRVAAAVDQSRVLDQTGTFLFTRAVESYAGPAPLDVLEPGVLYPFSKDECWDGQVFELEIFERLTRDAYTAHYWDGAWWERAATPLDGLPWTLRGQASDGPPAAYPEDRRRLKVSCITACDGWSPALDLAIQSYLRQTHDNAELLIVTERVDRVLAERLATYGRRGVKAARGAREASGDLLCSWPAGELQDPSRLEVQLRALTQTGASAAALSRRLCWDVSTRRLVIAAEAREPATVICRRDLWPPDALPPDTRVTVFDLPRLSLALASGETFESQWRAASARFEGERCDAVLDHLAKRLPVDALRHATRPEPRIAPPGEVLILTPVKNGRASLPRYLELACRLEAGGAPLSIAFMEGDSRDGSLEALHAAAPSLQARFNRVEIYARDDGLSFAGPRWAAEIQRERRGAIARARNRLLDAALRDATAWVLWLDVDLVDHPADLLAQLLATGKDIVVPHCVRPSGATFDLNTFLFEPGYRDQAADLLDGLFQPPRGKGRRYLEDVASESLVKVDSVGGTALLVRAELHRQGLRFPEDSYGGYIETEGLAMMARDRGLGCWALPQLRIVHADDAAPTQAA
ncbi:MAG TPA: glycosyltransferase [Caulobacteraceae bacterium]|nr:glycosyltransferase [Caulobacteraceae bacterium]